MNALLEATGVGIIWLVAAVGIAYWLIEVDHPGWIKAAGMLALGGALIFIGRTLP